MSTALATAPRRRPTNPIPAAPDEDGLVHLEIVSDRAQRRARPRVVYAMVAVGGVGALMLGQLLLSIAVSDGAYTIDRLETAKKEQARQVQQLSEDLGRLSSPQNLAKNAEALGMVQNQSPVWLRMSDGAVIGTPVAAAGGTGVVTANGSQVANDLLTGVPLVTELPPIDAAPVAATPDAVAAAAPSAPVASPGQLPAPITR